MDEVLRLLHHADRTLIRKEKDFFMQNHPLFGRKFAPRKLQVAQIPIEVIIVVWYTTTASELRPFVGLWNVYRRFVQISATLAFSHSQILNKKVLLHTDLVNV